MLFKILGCIIEGFCEAASWPLTVFDDISDDKDEE